MTNDATTIRETVRERYAERARRVSTLPVVNASCCGGQQDPVTANLYGTDDVAALPAAARAASLGCGGGIDVLLSAQRVGPDGFAYGLDMTDEMLALAERNRVEAGIENVRFLKGHIEDIPLEAGMVDVIISNCVINLSSDKGQVLREAYRVLRPGGRFAVSDIVTRGALPADLKADMEAWVGCVAGALDVREYRSFLADAGFEDIEVQVTRVHDPRELTASLGDGGCCGSGNTRAWDANELARFEASGGQVMSAFVRARKPVAT